MTAWTVLVTHGSQDPRAQRLFEALLATVRAQVTALVGSDSEPPDLPTASPSQAIQILGAQLELAPQSLDQQLMAGLAAGEAGDVVTVVPLLMGPGVHTREDIPVAIATLRQQRPDLVINLLPPLGMWPLAQALWQARLAHYPQISAWVLAAHGSRRPEFAAWFAQQQQQLAAATGNVVWSAFAAHPPTLEDQLSRLLAAGHGRIGIVPCFLFPNGLVDRWEETAMGLLSLGAMMGRLQGGAPSRGTLPARPLQKGELGTPAAPVTYPQDLAFLPTLLPDPCWGEVLAALSVSQDWASQTGANQAGTSQNWDSPKLDPQSADKMQDSETPISETTP